MCTEHLQEKDILFFAKLFFALLCKLWYNNYKSNNQGGDFMNRLSKIFLVIIIILVIALGIVSYFCIRYVNSLLKSNEQIYYLVKAANEAGFSCEVQEDGSMKLVEDTEN